MGHDNRFYTSRRFLIVLIAISLNVIITFRLFELERNFTFFLLLGVVVIADLIGLYYLWKKSINKPIVRGSDKVSKLLERMGFLKSTHVEVLSIKNEATIDNASSDESLFAVVESDTLTIQKPNKLIYRKPVYDKNIQLQKYMDDLLVYLSDNGLSVETNDIRVFFSALATSKLIIFNSSHPLLSERFLEVITNYIGMNIELDDLNGELSSFESLFKDSFQMKKTLSDAQSKNNFLFMHVLKGVDLEGIDQCLEPLIQYALDPLLPFEITNRYVQVKDMPKNVWVALIPNEDYKESMSLSMIESSIQVHLNIKPTHPKEEVFQNEFKMTYEYFMNSLHDAYDEYYIEETEWKKLDDIESRMKSHASYPIDNKLFRQMERFTSTFLLFGGDPHEAMDIVIYEKLLPIINKLGFETIKEDEEDIVTLFEKLFGLEYLGKSKTILKEIKEAVDRK